MGRAQGITEEQLRDLARYRESTAFSPFERLVIEYAEHATRTPAEIPESLFDQLRAHFNEAQLVGLTAAVAWENYRARFDHALAIEAQGFSEGVLCVLPERPASANQ